MKYLMLVCTDPAVTLTDAERAAMGPDTEAWVAEMDGRGVRLQGDRLAAAQDATTIRVRRGETVIAGGPFAETREQIAGYDILQCADLDEALEVAGKHPVARIGLLELRPFMEG